MGRLKNIPENEDFDNQFIPEREVVTNDTLDNPKVTKSKEQHSIEDLTDLELKAFAFDLFSNLRELEEKISIVNEELRKRANS